MGKYWFSYLVRYDFNKNICLSPLSLSIVTLFSEPFTTL
jgi:hypothetical protein